MAFFLISKMECVEEKNVWCTHRSLWPFFARCALLVSAVDGSLSCSVWDPGWSCRVLARGPTQKMNTDKAGATVKARKETSTDPTGRALLALHHLNMPNNNRKIPETIFSFGVSRCDAPTNSAPCRPSVGDILFLQKTHTCDTRATAARKTRQGQKKGKQNRR